MGNGGILDDYEGPPGGSSMSSRSERNQAVAIGMSARIVTPDSSLPDRLAKFDRREDDGELE